MAQHKTILLIGIDPFLIDFTTPEFAAFPGLTAEKVEGGMQGAMKQLIELDYEVQLCWTDFGQTALSVLEQVIKNKSFDVVLIGAGVRKPDTNFILFERMINTIHALAPQSKICFNTNPMDSVAAVQRWL